MPLNQNPAVADLLSWNGHDRGGVRVPFGSNGQPAGQLIPTRVTSKMEQLAQDLARGRTEPRWVFLVGGPGNGKSEAVQHFVEQLDEALVAAGAIVRAVAGQFQAAGMLRRRAEVDLPALSTRAKELKLGRLVIVQDASASDDALKGAAELFVDEIAELLTSTEPLPIFLACANRGLLATAIRETPRRLFGAKPVQLEAMLRSTGLGAEALQGKAACWPLKEDPRFAAWPLDVESLLKEQAGGTPFLRVLDLAVAEKNWSAIGACGDCDSATMCPLNANADLLRGDTEKASLARILRHGELQGGQRWTFRDIYSLLAELIVGQWGDFGRTSPCDWVHSRVAAIRSAQNVQEKARPTLELALRLYPQRLFRGFGAVPALEGASSRQLTATILGALVGQLEDESTYVRSLLTGGVHRRLDPALWNEGIPGDGLSEVEGSMAQGVAHGLSQQKAELVPLEVSAIEVLADAEAEWDEFDREMRLSQDAIALIRRLATFIVKRSIGVRKGLHGRYRLLADYEDLIRDNRKLVMLATKLKSLFGGNQFSGSLTCTFGQAEGPESSQVRVVGRQASFEVRPAPQEGMSIPAHDYPLVLVNREAGLPLTFDLFAALMARDAGCSEASLAPGTAATISRIRSLQAAKLARSREELRDGSDAYVTLGSIGRLVYGPDNTVELRDEGGAAGEP